MIIYQQTNWDNHTWYFCVRIKTEDNLADEFYWTGNKQALAKHMNYENEGIHFKKVLQYD